MKKLTTEEFKKRYKEKFGDLYNLDKVEYVNNKTEVIVTCPIHGDFKKRPDLLMDGCKCPKCSKTAKTSEEDFIGKAKYVHNNFFDYENGSFTNVSSPVGVICPMHGLWHPKANNHLNGANCPKCSKEGITHLITKLPTKNKSTIKYNTETFLEKVKEIHGEKYDLSKVEYVDNKTPIKIGCKIHGDFLITPNHLLSGRGCSKCSGNYHYTTGEIVKLFKKVHGDKYSYDSTNYTRTHDDITVKCKIHGDFQVSPANHIRGEGCPKCNNSKLEEEIRLLLEENNIKYNFRERNLKCLNGLELDFYIQELNVGIECQGIQHFEPVNIFGGKTKFIKRIENDKKKKELCDKNGIKLLYYSNLGIEYPYKVFENKKELLKEIKK